MALVEYPARFCDETPFLGRRYAYDPEREKYAIRMFEARLQVSKGTMFAEIDSPAGVPVMWVHGGMSFFGDGYPCAVGRVLSMGFEGKALTGTLGLSEADVLQYIPGGTDALDARVNSGLSVGIQYLDNPPVTWKLRDGTAEKPDQLTYGRVRIVEVSLTPMPRLYTAGLLGTGKRTGSEPQPEDPSDA